MNRLGQRAHANYGAFVVHRVSGLLLALFLPVHFWALGTAIEGEARFDAFLRWSAHPLVKFAEFGLVVLLAAHLAGGVRLLGLEFFGWQPRTQTVVAAGGGFALATGLVFLFNAGI